MKLKLLDIDHFIKNLQPVTTTELKNKSGEFTSDGLFSEKIFGIEGSIERSKRYSFIHLNTTVIHPAVYKLLLRIDKRFEKFFSTEKTFSINSEHDLVEDPNGTNGILEFISLFPSIKLRTGTPAREKIVKVIQDAYKQGTLTISALPVIPPNFRPIYEDENGNLVIDELNNIYLNIMRKASQIKTIKKEGSLFKLLNFYLQTAVNDHDKFIRTKI